MVISWLFFLRIQKKPLDYFRNFFFVNMYIDISIERLFIGEKMILPISPALTQLLDSSYNHDDRFL